MATSFAGQASGMTGGGHQEKNGQDKYQKDADAYENKYFKIHSKKKNIEDILIY